MQTLHSPTQAAACVNTSQVICAQTVEPFIQVTASLRGLVQQPTVEPMSHLLCRKVRVHV
jgi:hypothetical protein